MWDAVAGKWNQVTQWSTSSATPPTFDWYVAKGLPTATPLNEFQIVFLDNNYKMIPGAAFTVTLKDLGSNFDPTTNIASWRPTPTQWAKITGAVGIGPRVRWFVKGYQDHLPSSGSWYCWTGLPRH